MNSHRLLLSAMLLALTGAAGVEAADFGTVDTTHSRALTELAGELPDVVTAAAGPYLVTADIVVAPGRTVTIEPGSFLLFRNFTGVQVHGTLIAAGTHEQPIAFSSEHDRRHGSLSTQEPAPYDWNGITVTENAIGTRFEFCRIGYSLYGINALNEYVTIVDCMFRANAKGDFSIKGSRQEVVAGVPLSYKPLGELPLLPAVPGPSPAKITLRTTGIAVLLAGCAVGIWKTLEYRESDRHFTVLSNTEDPANLRNPAIVEEWQQAQDARNSDVTVMLLGFGAGALGAVAFGITFFF